MCIRDRKKGAEEAEEAEEADDTSQVSFPFTHIGSEKDYRDLWPKESTIVGADMNAPSAGQPMGPIGVFIT